MYTNDSYVLIQKSFSLNPNYNQPDVVICSMEIQTKETGIIDSSRYRKIRVCSGYQNRLANRPLMTLPTVNVIWNEIERQGQAKTHKDYSYTGPAKITDRPLNEKCILF